MDVGRNKEKPLTLLRAVLALAILFSVWGTGGDRQASARGVVSPDFSSVEMPAALGQTSLKVYVPETGHTVEGYLLDYWRANGASATYGNPISEPFAGTNGYYSQAFERGIFQYIPERVWTNLPVVKLMPITADYLAERPASFRADGRRARGGGDPRSSIWQRPDPYGEAAQNAWANGEFVSETTGHTVTGPFYRWYANNEGWSYLGDPISEATFEFGVRIQYFDGGALIQDRKGRIRLQPLPAILAGDLGIDTTPVEQGDLPAFDEFLFWYADNPNPIGDIATPGRRWIEVNVSEQILYAWQGDTLISSSYVSTGVTPNDTELGVFHVRYKLEITDMGGVVDSTGAVTELGTDAEAENGEETYLVRDIPHVLYFNDQAEALHGAYWHNDFGTRRSHGCVNLPLDFAAFIYGWAPLGTMIWVHE